MNRRVARIERVFPRKDVVEEPEITRKGYRLGDPAHGRQKHHAEHAIYVKTLTEAAMLVRKGFSLRMGAVGKRASLIAPKSLRVIEV